MANPQPTLLDDIEAGVTDASDLTDAQFNELVDCFLKRDSWLKCYCGNNFTTSFAVTLVRDAREIANKKTARYNRRQNWLAILLLLICMCVVFASSPASADYFRAGPAKATFCKGFVFKSCSTKRVDAFTQDGQLQTMPVQFVSVDSYKNGRCTVKASGIDGFFKHIPGRPRGEAESYTALGVAKYITFECDRT